MPGSATASPRRSWQRSWRPCPCPSSSRARSPPAQGQATDTTERREALVVLGVVFGAFALLRGVIPLIVWSVAIGALAGAAIWWERQARKGVEIDVAFEPRRVFAGEPVTMVVTVTNPGGVPLPVVRLAVWLPEGLSPPAELRTSALRGYRRRVALP